MPPSTKRRRSDFEEEAAASSAPDDVEEDINEDDLCPICHLLTYRPVTTRCKHTTCESCFSHWADVSLSAAMTRVDINETITSPSLLRNQIEARCPMCRTQTAASFDPEKEAGLIRKYPKTWKSRETEGIAEEDPERTVIESLTVYIGNTHYLQRTEDPETQLKHRWTFFVRPERTDLIEEVHIFLHPTFRNPHIILQYPPYAIARVGWGYFNVVAHIILKAGYSWVSSEAQDAPDGGEQGLLPLEWMLDFHGEGSQARLRLKIKKQRENVDEDVRVQGERSRRLWADQRRRDPDFVPAVED